METAIIAGIIGLITTVISLAATHSENNENVNRQKELADYENQWNSESSKVDRMVSAGATPAAAIQSALGSSSNGIMPTASNTVPFNVPNLGDTFSNAKLKDSEILTNQQQARVFGMQANKLGKYYDSMISENETRSLKNLSESGLAGATASYYREYASYLRDKKPWEIGNLAQGLKNLTAQYSNILADTNLKKSQSSLNQVKETTELTQQGVNESIKNLNSATEMNVNLEGYRLQFENDLRSAGINPTSRMGDNIVRLMITNPWQARKLLDNMSETANDIDGRLQNLLGKNYKRNIKLGAGMYYGYKAYDTMRDNALDGLNSFTGALGKVIPFAPSSSRPIGFK